MTETCSICGIAVAGADVLYTPDGRVACPTCFATIDAVASSSAPRWRMFAFAGGIAGAIPFLVHMSSSSMTTVNGEVTSFVYRDWIAVICGVIAATLGGATVFAARHVQLRRALAFAAGAGVIVLGGVQIARGFGVFEEPANSRASTSTSESLSISDQRPEPAPVDPKRPDTCPDQDTCFELGLALDKAGDLPGATLAYERACERGAGGGCFNAGFNWKRRDKPDLARAVAQFQRGCDLGELSSCSELGLAYWRGEGAAEDLARAKTIFEQACESDFGLACANLGHLYDRGGEGVPADPKRAFELLAKGCDRGDDEDTAGACDKAGGHLYTGEGVKKDLERAAAYFGKACERKAGYCYNLGVVTEHGTGVGKDPAKARALYDKACQADEIKGCNNLGHLLEAGLGGAKDKAAARALFQKACDGGFELGCENAKSTK